MASFQHFLLTRFNVRPAPTQTRLVTDPAWLARRRQLFEEFCYPSVCAQTAGDFTWLVFFDSATPEPFRARLARYAEFPAFVPVLVDAYNPAVVQQHVRSRLASHVTHVITSRMDNDDALAKDFLRQVQQTFAAQEFEFINFTDGYVWHRGRVYAYRDASNPFLSLIEAADAPRTVWAWRHREVSAAGPLRQVAGVRNWLQVIHEGNVANRVRGWRVPRSVLAGTFVVSAVAPEECAAAFRCDRFLLCPLRNLREWLIAVVKRILRKH